MLQSQTIEITAHFASTILLLMLAIGQSGGGGYIDLVSTQPIDIYWSIDNATVLVTGAALLESCEATHEQIRHKRPYRYRIIGHHFNNGIEQDSKERYEITIQPIE